MNKIKLENVRISFPSIFKRAVFEGIEGKYEATFLISKYDKNTYNVLTQCINQILKECKFKVAPDKICLKDGDHSTYDGYENNWSLKAASLKRPLVINKDKSIIYEEDEVIYPGCYVNAVIDFWVQNNKYGKRINSNLYGIQFVKDGEPFIKKDEDVKDQFDLIQESENKTLIDENNLEYSSLQFP